MKQMYLPKLSVSEQFGIKPAGIRAAYDSNTTAQSIISRSQSDLHTFLPACTGFVALKKIK